MASFYELIKDMEKLGFNDFTPEIIPLSLIFDILHSKKGFIRKKLIFLRVENHFIKDKQPAMIKFSLPKYIKSFADVMDVEGNEELMKLIQVEAKRLKR
jgi:hypothetical protein